MQSLRTKKAWRTKCQSISSASTDLASTLIYSRSHSEIYSESRRNWYQKSWGSSSIRPWWIKCKWMRGTRFRSVVKVHTSKRTYQEDLAVLPVHSCQTHLGSKWNWTRSSGWTRRKEFQLSISKQEIQWIRTSRHPSQKQSSASTCNHLIRRTFSAMIFLYT